MTDYCEECGAELPGDCSGGCADVVSPGLESLVDGFMARGYDRDEAELLAQRVLEDDAA